MLMRRRVMIWRRIWKSFQAVSAHGLIFSFTLLLALKLDHIVSHSWWFIFTPLWWLFHAVIARGRFSLPAPSMPHDHWGPFYSVMATPLLVAFEILICVHLENKYVVNLKIVFLPLLAFEVAKLVDNVRMCRTLMPGDEETMSNEAIWEALPHSWVSISLFFFIAATTFTLLKLCGDVAALGWWDLFINLGIAVCFGFLVCKKWSNRSIHRYSHLQWNRGLVVTADQENQNCNRTCGYVMKIPFITFQIILFMRLEGTPASAKNIPILVLFVPLFLLQGAVVLFATYRLVEKSVLLISSGVGSFPRYFTATSSGREFLVFFQRGARLFCWWSIDEGGREEQARLYSGDATGYNTFSPEVVKKMPKSDLVQEEKILCKVCFEDSINVVLLPCRHYVLCSTCSKKCKKCPICRVLIKERMPVYDA